MIRALLLLWRTCMHHDRLTSGGIMLPNSLKASRNRLNKLAQSSFTCTCSICNAPESCALTQFSEMVPEQEQSDWVLVHVWKVHVPGLSSFATMFRQDLAKQAHTKHCKDNMNTIQPWDERLGLESKSLHHRTTISTSRLVEGTVLAWPGKGNLPLLCGSRQCSSYDLRLNRNVMHLLLG